MPIKHDAPMEVRKHCMIKIIYMLLAFTLGATSAFAQDPIKKPEKKQQTTTTTTTKPTTSTNTNKRTQTKTNTQTNSNSSANSTNTQESNSSTTTTTTTITTLAPKPTMGYINGHEWVDMGLSVKWATCNVGASSPSDYGNYYAWGEISTKAEYSQANSRTWGKSIDSIAGNSQYDAARANWGSTWRLPTASELDELINKCTWTWTSQGGHHGCKVTGPSGNSIFLPAVGWRDKTSHEGEGSHYWVATPYEGNANVAYDLFFTSGAFLKT